MSIQIYNTFTRTREKFRPVEPGRVRMYVCGITAYDRCHIGHARSAIVFDTIVRHLRHRGYDVIFIRNFTDIDDKIINRANELGISTSTLAEDQIRNFYEDMDRLHVARPTAEPRATGHIEDIIQLIERLIEKGHAYQADSDVYFAVRSFETYGALSRRDVDDMRAGARIAVGEKKRDPLDFALWKGAKPGEPSWPSPWGSGRPGWHIECSAMSMKYLGDTLDIHGGGLDLIFPHHENERAQSEAATGKTYVRYWMHNGFVTIDGEKMSKSLGNFITIEEILRKYHPETLRLFLLSMHYRSPLNYSEKAMSDAETALARCYSAISEAKSLIRQAPKKKRPLSDVAKNAADILRALPERFDRAMDDDFNTAMATGILFEGVKAMNRVIQEARKKNSSLLAEVLDQGIRAMGGCGALLGILNEDADTFLRNRDLKAISEMGLSEEWILEAIEKRTLARKEKDWSTADAIREELSEKGIILRDGPQGTTWSMKQDV